jgi:putative transcriptional regulator
MPDITNRLKDLRGAQGVTQEELADAVGVSRQTIIAVEKGNYVPSLLLAMRIARFFKARVEDVFTLKK